MSFDTIDTNQEDSHQLNDRLRTRSPIPKHSDYGYVRSLGECIPANKSCIL